MINQYILLARKWYEQRNTREKLFVIALSWAVLYLFFTYIVYRPIENRKIALSNEIKAVEVELQKVHAQIKALDSIAATPLYKKWYQQRQSYQKLQGQYKSLILSSAKQWQEILYNVIRSNNQISIVQVKNSPEALYEQTKNTETLTKIYQQGIILDITTDYFNLIEYLKGLEKALPFLHWDQLSYKVTQYPMANVELEFSILYEKTNPPAS